MKKQHSELAQQINVGSELTVVIIGESFKIHSKLTITTQTWTDFTFHFSLFIVDIGHVTA